jgi:hypothetical protein
MFVLSEGTILDPALLPAEMNAGIAPTQSFNFKSQTEAATRGAAKQMIITVKRALERF